MSVIITGNNGFIGRNLTERTGWDGFDTETDIVEYDKVLDAIEDYDTVIHLAAEAGVKRSLKEEKKYIETNIHGTYNVAFSCWDLGKRLIFASSSSVYEAKSPYAKTKQGAEDVIGAFARHGLNALVLRLFTVFGEYNRKDMAVYKFTQAIRNQEPIELYGDCSRDFTYVGDLCRAIQNLAPMNFQGTYDLGFGRSIPVIEMIYAIQDVIGQGTTIKQMPQRDFDAKSTKADPTLMNRLKINRTPLKQALKHTVKTI